MDESIEEFVVALTSERKSSPNTLGAYRTDLRQLSQFLRQRGVTVWSEVTPALITDFVLDLRNREYAPTSIARKVAALKSFFHHLHTRTIIANDPSEALQAPKVEKYLPHALTPHEVQQLFEAVKPATGVGQRDLAMLHTLYS
ncbi:MAG: site-specific integrase, partial [Ktedonobacterales bacterium]